MSILILTANKHKSSNTGSCYRSKRGAPTFNLEVQHLLVHRIPHMGFSSQVFYVADC